MPKPSPISTAQFLAAMSEMPKPGRTMRKLLKSHHNARGRVSAMSLLAEAAGFTSFSPANLHYGARPPHRTPPRHRRTLSQTSR